jgi:hypothetical protein
MSTQPSNSSSSLTGSSRAIQWLLIAVMFTVGFLVWDTWVRKLNTTWSNRADAIERNLQKVHDARTIEVQFRRMGQTVASLGEVEPPGDAADGADALTSAVNRLCREYRVSNDSFDIRTEGKLPKDLLRTVTGGARLETIKCDLEFESAVEDALSIIAALESNPKIESVRSVRMRKVGDRKVNTRLVVEAWVLSTGT